MSAGTPAAAAPAAVLAACPADGPGARCASRRGAPDGSSSLTPCGSSAGAVGPVGAGATGAVLAAGGCGKATPSGASATALGWGLVGASSAGTDPAGPPARGSAALVLGAAGHVLPARAVPVAAGASSGEPAARRSGDGFCGWAGEAGAVTPASAGVSFAGVPAAASAAPVPAVVFGRAPDGGVARVLPAGADLFAATDDASVVAPSAGASAPPGPTSRPPAWPRPVAVLAARDRLPVRAGLPASAGALRAVRLGAGPVPLPVELSPGIPFSEVTAP
jgi:hypothetical protein